MFRGICHKHAFTKDQVEQMDLLRDSYCASLGVTKDALPTLFGVDAVRNTYRAKTRPSTNNYNLGVWTPRLGKGLLRTYVEDIISSICAYQLQRASRPWYNNGYTDEPIQLACEEFKEWLVILSSSECNEDTLAKVEQRINYLDRLIAADAFLPTDPACREAPDTLSLKGESMTFYSILLEIRLIVVEEVKQEIMRELNNRSAREYLRDLMANCRQAVQHSLGYLFYILRAEHTPKNFSMNNLLTAETSDYKKILVDTKTGQCLKILAEQNSFDEHHGNMLTQVKSAHFINPFFTADDKLDLPFKDYKKENLSKDKNSGINKDLRDKAVVDQFILLHGLTSELINLDNILQLAYHLAGTGGDLLVYGFANSEVNTLLNAMDLLMRQFRETVRSFHLVTTNFAIRLYRQNTRDHATWRENYRYASQYYDSLMEDLNSCYQKINKLRGKVNAIPLKKRLQEAKAELQNFTVISSGYVQDFMRRFAHPTSPAPSSLPGTSSAAAGALDDGSGVFSGATGAAAPSSKQIMAAIAAAPAIPIPVPSPSPLVAPASVPVPPAASVVSAALVAPPAHANVNLAVSPMN